jgi:hypothetical protein
MTIEEELSYITEKVLGRLGVIPVKLYKEGYEALHGEGSCALTSEIKITPILTIRFALDYKGNKKLLASNISLVGGQPIVISMKLDSANREEQLKNFVIMITIDLYNFLNKLAKLQQGDLNKTRGVMTQLKKTLNEI